MITFHNKNNVRNCVLALIIILGGCGGDASQFSDENIEPITIEPITGSETGGDDGGEGGSDGSGTPTIGGSLTPEEFALLPEVSTGQRQFSDPNVAVTLFGSVQAKGDATITNTLWKQVGGTNATIINPTRLNTQVLVPATDFETLLTFQLVAQDSEGRVNASTTSIVVEPINTVGIVNGGIVSEDAVTAIFTFKLSEPSDQATTINYATFDGTAKAGIDYEETIGSSTLEPGVTDQTIEVTLLSPGLTSDSKSFYMRITVPTDEVVAVTTVGAVIIQSNEITELAAPNLTDITDRSLVISEAILPITFENLGGDQVLRCLAPAGLPLGLTVDISADELSCEISGTPTELSEEQSYMVVATNPTGIAAATVNISVVEMLDLEIPVLGSIAFQSFTVDTEIAPLSFVNSGGRIESCESLPPLPAGLILTPSFDVESNTDSCVMSGAPSVTAENMQYSIRGINAAGVGAIGTSLEVNVPTLLPNLTTLPLQTLLVSEAEITPISFVNTGGGIISACVSNPTLPVGLDVAPSENQETCVITGTTSTELEATTYEISVTNPSGTSLTQVSLSIEIPVVVTEAPDLQRLDLWVISTGEDIQPIPFQNNGGIGITGCSDITEGIATLESVGLQVVPTDDRSSCQLIGAYLSSAVEGTFNLLAENSAGSNEFQVALDGRSFETSITLAPQDFLINAPVSQRFDVGTQSYFSSCTVEPSLPAGLQVTVSDDVDVFNTCIITGTPTELSDAQTYTFSAQNPNGTVTEDVSISVLTEADFVPPSLGLIRPKLFRVGQDITFFDFQNTGGEIINCSSEPTLPPGLAIGRIVNEVGNTDCRLSGTPDEVSAVQDYVISASNAGGSSTSTITIEVAEPILEIPLFLEEPDLIFEVGGEMVEFEFVNSGGAVDTCSPDRTLPMGIDLNAVDGTCVISGIPVLRQLPTSYEITASNDSGDETANITIASYAVPALLGDLGTQVYTVENTITGLGTLQDTGGGELISCGTSPDLPAGLLYQLNEANDNCDLTGRPTIATVETEYVLFAENQVGTGNTSILITVEEPVISESFEVPFDNATALEISVTVSEGEASIDWGDGTDEVISNGRVERTFVEPSSGLATITISNGFAAITDFSVTFNNGGGFNFEASIFENFINMETFLINHGTLNGNLSSFSALDKLRSFSAPVFVTGTDAVFDGEISDIPSSITSFTLNVPDGILSGDFADLKSNEITSISILSGSDITGELSSLSSLEQLQSFRLTGGDSSLTGFLSDLPNSLSTFDVDLGEGSLIEGDVSDLSDNMNQFEISGPNAITGDISDLTDAVTRFVVSNGSNTITGDLGQLQNPSPFMFIGGLNSITFDNTAPTWLPSDNVTIVLTGDSTAGMTLNQTDDFLQYIADVVSGTNTSSRIELSRIGDQGRSLNSEIAVEDLEDFGFVIDITLIFNEG